MIGKRLYRGRIQAQREGYSIGSRPPYGYGEKGIGKGHVPVPDDSAEAVRYIFGRYARHGTAANILHGLNDMAIPAVTGAKWTAYAIREAIENRTCIGKIDTETVRCGKSIEDGKAVQRRLDDYGPVTVEGRHGPIADEGLSWKCREVRDGEKAGTGSDRTLKNPFASMMSCSVCGKTMRRTRCDCRGGRTFCYGCRTSRRVTGSTFTHAVYDMVVGELERELDRRQAILADCGTSPGHDAGRDGLEMPKDGLGRKPMMPERACEAYGTGVYGRQAYLERVRKVDAARAGLQARVGELESGERHGKAVPILTGVVGEMHTLNPKGRNGLPKMIVDGIGYEETESGAAIGPTPRISLEI